MAREYVHIDYSVGLVQMRKKSPMQLQTPSYFYDDADRLTSVTNALRAADDII
jgi:hypothetical protein